jgi:lipopolysaccharide/colanic/teichoic acid biosynthesis glycosyltransferase
MPKRVFDVTTSATLIIALSPLLIIIAVAIRMTSPGPVFHRGTRVGRNQQLFTLYKFRSMVVDADKIGPGITASGDLRITPVGHWLRRMKLDELPQLFNVLRGDMSLVGPRPEDPRYVALYTPEQLQILRVRPGITSPASVEFRNEQSMLTGPDWEQAYIHQIMPTKLRIDLEYFKTANLLRDIRVLIQTFQILWR